MDLISLLPARFLFKQIKKTAANPERSIKNVLTKNPEFFEQIGMKLALAQFRRSYNLVPAYKTFIDKANISKIASYKDFLEKVPEIDKKDYIQKNTLKELCINGKLDNANLVYRSSGFSGKPAYWCRSLKELELNKKQVTSSLRLTFHIHERKTLIVNCFDLSSWVSGVNFAKVADEETDIINVGTNQEEAVEIIQDIGRQFDQIILSGYPPFMKWLFDSSKKVNWKDYKINLLLGGEGFTSSYRGYMYENYIRQGIIVSAYGTSDLGIPCASETPASMEIIRNAEKNEELKKELFFKEGQIPMLFQYNPTTYHIYPNKSCELIFTMLNLDAIQPLVKYNIHDLGGVVQYNKMKEILQKNNINISVPLKFPFLYVYGRSTGEVKVCGTLIYPENIKEAIYKNKEIADKVTGVFRMYTKEGTKSVFCVDMELNKGLRNFSTLQKKVEYLLEDSLSQVNADYKDTRKLSPKETKIHLKLFNHGSFPHKSGIKIKYS